MNILVVEDEAELCDSIAEDLTLEGYTVSTCYHGADAYNRNKNESYHLVILDLNLPGMDGLDLLQLFRIEHPEWKVLILSARSHSSDKILGLDLGANDYLTKPFSLRELEARVRCLLRRLSNQWDSSVRLGCLCLDPLLHKVTARGQPLDLTPAEVHLLAYFMLHPGQIIPAETLLTHMQKQDRSFSSRGVHTLLSALRKKLRQTLEHDPIHTKLGRGYLLEVNHAS